MNQSLKYKVAISLAGKHVHEAKSLKQCLVQEHSIPSEKIYLYTDQGSENIGKKIKPALRDIYHSQSSIIVVFLSQAYLDNELTKPEWEAIKTRLARGGNFLIPIRMEEGIMIKDQDELEGFYDISWTEGVGYIAKVIVERLKKQLIPRESKENKSDDDTTVEQQTNIQGNVEKNISIRNIEGNAYL